MKNGLMTRGGTALATIVCLAALASTAAAQTNYYWQGGVGNWFASPSSPGYTTSDSTSWIPNGSLIPNGSGGNQVTGTPGAWVNSTTSVAYIGYSTTSGTGGANMGAGIDQFSYYGPATPITLDPAGITAQQLFFGENQNSHTLAEKSQYTLGGGPLYLDNGNITLDLSNSNNFDDFGAQITSNLTCGAGGSAALQLNTNLNNSYNPGEYYATYLFLSGSNSYNNIVVGGQPSTTSSTKPSISAIVFSNTQSVSLNSLGQAPTVTLGCNAGIDDYAPDNSQMTFGNITLNPNAGNPSYGVTFARQVATYGQWGNSRGFIGAGSEYTVGQQFPNITVGAISGQGDMMFCSGNSNDGLGIITVNGASTYTGDTFFVPYSTRVPAAYGTAILRMGVDNALPATTNLILGNLGNSGEVDLNSHYLQVASVATFFESSNQDDYHGAITNFNSSGTATLAICNNVPQLSTIEAQLHLVIGKSVLDSITTRSTNSANSNNNIALALLAGNNGTLTLGLAQQGETPPGSTFAQANTYNGGTTIAGGALFADNGSSYWSGPAGGAGYTSASGYGTPNDGQGNALTTSTTATVQNSATGTGPVVVKAGGTLGGSAHLGGAIGMPTTGPVTVQSGGYLLPGGGYFNDNTGAGSGSFAINGNFTLGGSETVAVAVDPAFTPTVGATPLHVLGDLNLCSSSTVNFNFNPTGGDSIVVGGNLNLAGGTGTVNIGISLAYDTTVNSGVPLFTFAGTLTGGTANISSPTATALGDSFQVVGNQIDLITGGPKNLVWTGSNNGATWDTATTSNFAAAGVATVFSTGDKVTFDDTSSHNTVTITGSGVSPAAVNFNNTAKTYTVQGGPINDNSNTPVNIGGGGTVIFSNTNAYAGGTNISANSTLQVTNAGALPNSPSNVVNIGGGSTLQLNYTDGAAVSNSSSINFPGGTGGALPIINVPAGTVTLAGALSETNNAGAGGFQKTGSGTLLLTNAQDTPVVTSQYTGVTHITGGFIEVNSTYGADAGASYSALGSGEVDIAQGTGTGGLWLNNVNVGVLQNQGTTDLLGGVDMYTGGTLKGTGNSSLARTHVASVLNCISIGVAGPGSYLPGSFTLTTGNASTDVLALAEEVRQFDPNYTQNGYVNYLPGNPNNGNYVVTAHVAGAGTVKLQSGGVDGDTVFGGAWSIDSGILQLGPYSGTSLATTATTNPGQSSGPGGEIFNALGFKSTYDTGSSGSVHGNPDLPNPVTVNAGGMLAIANDQINGNAVNGLNTPANPTQPYYRNTVTLSGGTLAATGAEVTWNYSSTDGSQGLITQSNAAVVARLGGEFDLTPSTTSTILTYDPNGLALDSTGSAIAADGIRRTVELVGGSNTLQNASPGIDAGTTLTYNTNWAGNLLIASSNGVGGMFNIKRSGGMVTVTPGATMTIQAGATVNISNDDSSTLVMDTNSDANYGYMVPGLLGTLPVLNNVLSAGGNSVAIINSGTFNVNAGTQTVGAITSDAPGTFNVTSTATVNTPSIQQGTASVASGATLNITGPGALAPSMVLANSGVVNLSSGTQSASTVGTSAGQNVGSVILSAPSELEANEVYQNSITIDAGAKLALTATHTAPVSTATTLSIAGATGAWTGDLDVGQSGITLSSATLPEAATAANQLREGYLASWGGTGGITSSFAHTSGGAASVGEYYNSSAHTLKIAAAIPGDCNLAGQVTGTDLNIVESHLGASITAGENWQSGDFAYAGQVTGADLNIVESHLGASFPAVEVGGPVQLNAGASQAVSVEAVPEPGTLALLAAGLAVAGIAAVRRRAKIAG